MSNSAIQSISEVAVIPLNALWLYLSVGIAILLLLFFFFLLKKKIKPRKKGAPPTKNQQVSQNPNTKQILNILQKATGPVLLAASGLADLPVTVPVNLAVSLTKTGKCLLIDFDSKRDALARVFEVDSTKINHDLRTTPIQTEFENLSVWPAEYFNLLKQMNLCSLLDTANEKYDHILLYAPYLTVLTDREHIAFRSKQAVVFCKDKEKNSPLQDLLKKCDCKILLET